MCRHAPTHGMHACTSWKNIQRKSESVHLGLCLSWVRARRCFSGLVHNKNRPRGKLTTICMYHEDALH